MTEPFGYFKAEPFGWTDCAATDEGAVALYEHPPAQTAPVQPVALLNGIKRYEPEIFREDRIRMELDQSGEWVKYADVELLITNPPAAQQCKWPTCQTEEHQQALAEQIKQELVTGTAQPEWVPVTQELLNAQHPWLYEPM